MPVWETELPQNQPVVLLDRWRVIQIKDGTRHFVGREFPSTQGRVSNVIVELDPTTKSGITSTGRRYELCGSPGRTMNGDYVLDRWLRMHNEEIVADLSETFWNDISAHAISHQSKV
ncbi:MAG TPA: hypothetical protein VGK09_02445 [Rhodocyclaceae bacterium]|jgi:hypothetical protein